MNKLIYFPVQSQNLDKNEIDKFSELSSQWWDKSGPNFALHAINPLRLKFMQDNIYKLNNQQVLDLGCGGGILTTSLAKLGAKMTGIDASSKCIKVAKLKALEQGLDINYRVSTVEQFSAEQNKEEEEKTSNKVKGLSKIPDPQQFDIITCMEMLEHVPNPAQVIQLCGNLLKPKGKLFLSTLNRNLKSFIFGIVAAEYILGLVPKGTHSYQNFIRPSELVGCAEKFGFKLEDMRGISYNPISKSFFSSDDVSINYMICLVKQ